MIVLTSAAGRAVIAAELLGMLSGLPDEAMTMTIDEVRAAGLFARHDSDPVPGYVPGTWRVEWLINRAADEARHAAQEALDEVAHTRGWPR